MSFDKPGGSGDDDPGRQNERRPCSPGLSRPGPDWMEPGYADRRLPSPRTDPAGVPATGEIRERRAAVPGPREYARACESGYSDSDERENRDGQDRDRPPVTGDGDRQESSGQGAAGRNVPREFLLSDGIPFTRKEAFDAARDPDAPEPGSREWLEAKAELWERRAAGEDVEIPGRDIPFTRDDVREWADSPDRDVPAPGSPVWEAWKAGRAGRDRPAVTGGPDGPQPLQAGAPDGNGEGTRTAGKTESTGKDAEQAGKLEAELAETRSELAETKAELAGEKADRRRLTGVVADLSEENKRLRAELAEARDKPGERAETGEQTRVEKSSGTVSREGKADHRDDACTPWYRKLPPPGEKATELFTAGAAAAGAVGVATHSMNSTTEKIVGAAIGLGVAGYGYARAKRKENEENDG